MIRAVVALLPLDEGVDGEAEQQRQEGERGTHQDGALRDDEVQKAALGHAEALQQRHEQQQLEGAPRSQGNGEKAKIGRHALNRREHDAPFSRPNGRPPRAVFRE